MLTCSSAGPPLNGNGQRWRAGPSADRPGGAAGLSGAPPETAGVGNTNPAQLAGQERYQDTHTKGQSGVFSIVLKFVP